MRDSCQVIDGPRTTGGVVRRSKVINFAGAFIALLIGSGFATGQEIMQYFVAWGYKGIVGIVVCFALFAYVGMSFISAGYNNRFEKPNDIYKYYCGKHLGTFYDYFSTFFLFLSFIVMLGGAGATAHQHYGVSPYVGAGVMAALAVLTVILGLGKIVEVIGHIGPAIVILAIFVGTVSIIMNLNGASEAPALAAEYVQSGQIKAASTNWLLAAFSYVGFNSIWLTAFLGQVGATASSDKEAKLGAFGGALGFSVAVFLMAFGILFSVATLKGSQIPTLILAGSIHPVFGNVFSVVILLGIYTTSVPLLWSVVARFSKEKTPKFKGLSIILGIAGLFIALMLNFDELVNVVYVFNGYVGMILLIILIARSIQWKKI